MSTYVDVLIDEQSATLVAAAPEGTQT